MAATATPALEWVWITQSTSSRPAWMALWMTKPAWCIGASGSSMTLPSRSTLMRFVAVTSSNSSPKRLSRKWPGSPGTRAEMWV